MAFDNNSMATKSPHDDPDDRRFYRHHVFFNKPGTLDWLIDRAAVSPEDDIIAHLDGETPEHLLPLPPLPTLDGINDDLVWIWHCRESGMTWGEVAGNLGLKTPAGAWKRYHKLIDAERKKAGLSLRESS